MKEYYTNDGRHRTVHDDDMKIYYSEWQCRECSVWMRDADVVWRLYTGQPDTIFGEPWCAAHAPTTDAPKSAPPPPPRFPYRAP